jgi:hypothetical protein
MSRTYTDQPFKHGGCGCSSFLETVPLIHYSLPLLAHLQLVPWKHVDCRWGKVNFEQAKSLFKAYFYGSRRLSRKFSLCYAKFNVRNFRHQKKVYCTWLKFVRQHRGPFLTVENKVVEVPECLPHRHQICVIPPQFHYKNRYCYEAKEYSTFLKK